MRSLAALIWCLVVVSPTKPALAQPAVPLGFSLGVGITAYNNMSRQNGPSGARRTSAFTAGQEVLAAYTFPKGWRLETGWGDAEHTLDLRRDDWDTRRTSNGVSTVSAGFTLHSWQLPVRLEYPLPVFARLPVTFRPQLGVALTRNRFHTPEQFTYLDFDARRNEQAAITVTRTPLGSRYRLGYSAGLVASTTFKRFELRISTRYTNLLGSNAAAQYAYSYTSVPSSLSETYTLRSRLTAWTFGATLSYYPRLHLWGSKFASEQLE